MDRGRKEARSKHFIHRHSFTHWLHTNSQIIDDGYQHSLIVYQDALTNGIRLHAAVWEGELRECPVWTVFVTHPTPLTGNRLLPSDETKSENSANGGKGWLEPRGKHIVWLHDIQLYVFCEKYREANMRRNRKKAFEIYFVGIQGEFFFITDLSSFSFFFSITDSVVTP